MPSKKRPSKPAKSTDDSTAWQVILERIEAQNRATIELVQGHHDELVRDLQDFRTEVRNDVSMLQTAVKQNSADIARVEAKVDKLVPLEERVVVLEKRLA